MKPVLIGMNNPYGGDPRYALYPAPKGCTGYRLWQLLQSRRAEVTRLGYANAFDRVNLVQGPWSMYRGREGADFLRPSLTGRTCVVLGEEVRRCFDLPKQLIHPIQRDGVIFRQLPHPSGRNPWYNSRENRELAAMLLEELYNASDVRDAPDGATRAGGCPAAAEGHALPGAEV